MIDRPMYIDKVMAYTDAPFVKILTGVRRCGKSTILKMIMERLRAERAIPESQIVSYRFDSMEYEDMTAKQMYAELKSRLSTNERTYFFLDEIQEVSGWEKVVNSLLSDF
ncbi:MAG: AAA family ATPase, partial [Lachnospiraceae bacterium]|nr:AAA family ATPase [Lachnospiraceae bacterium]